MPQIPDETVTVEEVAEEAVEHDQELTEDVRDAKRRAGDAKRRSSEAIAVLNQWRWEMTRCPLGPRYSQEAYAAAVGQTHRTIGRGADAWEAEASDSGRDAQVCSLGTEPHDQQVPPPLTDDQVDRHDKARRRLDAGKVKAIVIEQLARYWGVVPTTIEVNKRALVNEAVNRLNTENDVPSMTETEVTEAADRLARQMRLEFQQREARTKAVQKWMTKNRARDAEVPITDARKMVVRIERRMESREWSWAQAERDLRDWDWAHCEAERISNELERAARIAVLELRSAAAAVKLAAIRVGQAMRTIEADEIPMSSDELELVEADLADADAIVRQARAAVGGSSGTDWDAALAELTPERGK